MPGFEMLGSLVTDIHHEFQRMYFVLLPVFFCIALVSAWIRHPQGGPDFIDIIKRALLATVLLIAFPDISHAIVSVADGIAERIDDMSSLNEIFKMASEKVHSYSISTKSLIIGSNDLFVGVIVFVTYLVILIARTLTIAMYHFYWDFYVMLAPLLLLFNLFPSTSQITKNLFKGMIQVASWKIMWALLSAMLKSLSFGAVYAKDSTYTTLIVMNLIIAISMIRTPAMVSALMEGGFVGTASTTGTAAGAFIIAAPFKAVALSKKAAMAFNPAKKFTNMKLQNYQDQKRK